MSKERLSAREALTLMDTMADAFWRNDTTEAASAFRKIKDHLAAQQPQEPEAGAVAELRAAALAMLQAWNKCDRDGITVADMAKVRQRVDAAIRAAALPARAQPAALPSDNEHLIYTEADAKALCEIAVAAAPSKEKDGEAPTPYGLALLPRDDLLELIRFWRTFPPPSNEVAASDIIEQLLTQRDAALERERELEEAQSASGALPGLTPSDGLERELYAAAAKAIQGWCDGEPLPLVQIVDDHTQAVMDALAVLANSVALDGGNAK